MTIPIRNLYYLFCYAWNLFPGGKLADLDVDDCPDVPHLLARMLVAESKRLLRRGLDRGYRPVEEETRSPRGRILLDAVIKSQTLLRGTVVCSFDELTVDILANQIIRSTARRLAAIPGLDTGAAHDLRLLTQRLDAVSDVPVTGDLFRRVMLHRNNRQYDPVLRLCEFIFRTLLPLSAPGDLKLPDILSDEVVMSTVYEEFLRGFYRLEQSQFVVSAESFPWDAVGLDNTSNRYMPTMNTDITLRSQARVVVMDAKFYSTPFPNHMGKPRIHAPNLYQLFAYMEHVRPPAAGGPVDGALIYAAVDGALRLRYSIRGHYVHVVAIDLTLSWRHIHDDLLAVIEDLHANVRPGPDRSSFSAPAPLRGHDATAARH